MNVLLKIVDTIQKMLYPQDIKCILCDEELVEDTLYGTCNKCQIDFNTQYCSKCGRALDNLATFCNDCMNNEQSFDEARAPTIFGDSVNQLVYRLKYGNAQYLAKYMGEMMYDMLVLLDWDIDYIIPVPIHPKRKAIRGYNQSNLLAQILSKKSKIKNVKDWLIKTVHVTNLAKLNKAERAKAIINTFAIATEKSSIKGKKFLLVDDILTSGATANECCRMLKKNGATKVYVMTFATGKIKAEVY